VVNLAVKASDPYTFYATATGGDIETITIVNHMEANIRGKGYVLLERLCNSSILILWVGTGKEFQPVKVLAGAMVFISLNGGKSWKTWASKTLTILEGALTLLTAA
jgi:hypothetical protein